MREKWLTQKNDVARTTCRARARSHAQYQCPVQSRCDNERSSSPSSLPPPPRADYRPASHQGRRWRPSHRCNNCSAVSCNQACAPSSGSIQAMGGRHGRSCRRSRSARHASRACKVVACAHISSRRVFRKRHTLTNASRASAARAINSNSNQRARNTVSTPVDARVIHPEAGHRLAGGSEAVELRSSRRCRSWTGKTVHVVQCSAQGRTSCTPRRERCIVGRQDAIRWDTGQVGQTKQRGRVHLPAVQVQQKAARGRIGSSGVSPPAPHPSKSPLERREGRIRPYPRLCRTEPQAQPLGKRPPEATPLRRPARTRALWRFRVPCADPKRSIITKHHRSAISVSCPPRSSTRPRPRLPIPSRCPLYRLLPAPISRWPNATPMDTAIGDGPLGSRGRRFRTVRRVLSGTSPCGKLCFPGRI